ncbi:S-adenosyl-L-methionine-dependent methyltransferase [Daedaleopsis nitida]|nr:S-adenosyl-L-methionine-dependent methyltransferase [Daedaleopsis nitida]
MDWKSSDIAQRYKTIGVITGPFGLHLVKQCGFERADGSEQLVVLDNACGTGVVTLNLYSTLSPAAKANIEAVCGDFSPGMVKSVQERIEENGWTGATAKVVDAQNMDLPSNYFTHVLTSFALVGVSKPRTCLAETFRVLRPRGTAGFTIWKFVGWYPLAVAALASIPGAPTIPAFNEFGKVLLESPTDDERWTEPAFFEGEMRKVGFEEVETVLHENVTHVKTAEEYVKTYATMTRTLLGNLWSDEEKALVASAFDDALLKVVKARFGDGDVSLSWEAYCVTARTPESKV